MTYYNGDPRTGKPEITQVLCDDCATQEVKIDKYGMQEIPWRWSPVYGDKCNKCGKLC